MVNSWVYRERSMAAIASSLLALLLVAPLLAACEHSPSPVSTTPPPAPPAAVDRIAYAGDDGNVYTVNGDGTDRRQHTLIESGPVASLAASGLAQARSSYYAWPTWSPDGRRLAVSRVVNEGTSRDGVDLRAINLATGEESVVYANNLSSVAFVAQGAPHYPYWRPDSSQLAFLASGPSGLTLYTVNIDPPADAIEVVAGVPLYFVWAPAGSGALLHVGPTLLAAESMDGPERTQLPMTAGAFRAPSFSPGGQRMAYVDAAPSGGTALYTAEADGANPAPVTGVEGQAAFLWSPSERRIAYLDAPVPGSLLFTALSVVDANTGEELTAIEGLTLAFFWSPDGSRLAYVTVDDGGEWLVWNIAMLDGSPPRELGRFLPSPETFIMLSFFDQYAHSHAVWSPEGSRLVFAGRLPEPDGTVRAGNRVIVVDVTGVAAAEAIADGTAAFWSWR